MAPQRSCCLWIALLAVDVAVHALVVRPARVSSQARFRTGAAHEAVAAGGATGRQDDGVKAKVAVVALTQQSEGRSPAATLRDLSEAAELYGIEEQDVYGGGAQWMADFEQEVASTLGKEAAVFCPSGVMAQLISLKIHAASGHGGVEDAGEGATSGSGARAPSQDSFVCHPSSHLLLHEERAYEKVLGFDSVPLGVMKRPASYEDLSEALRPYDDGSSERKPPSSVVLELPHRELGGACTSREDVKKMAKLLKDRGIAFHCDGARLWEAQPFYGESFGDLCSSFDSVYVSFYKGLDGMTGAMLIGSAPFVAEARVWLRRFGGNVYTSLPYAVSCLHAFRKNMGTFEDRWHKLRRVTALIDALALEGGEQNGAIGTPSSASRVAERASDASAPPRVRFEPPLPQCSLVHCYVRGSQAVLERARDQVLEKTGVKVFGRLRGTDGEGSNGRPDECYFEWNIGPANSSIDDGVFVEAWASFLDAVESCEAG